jgi:DNA-directed RNA polymerase specialized sigma24 family protein
MPMPPENRGSVTCWIGDLKVGGDSAAQHFWERYFDRLVQLARKKLQAVRHRSRVEDEEDAALSAFDSFCRGVARGQFPLLTDRDDLWRLLVVLTVRKALNQARRHTTEKRGGGKLVGESSLPGGDEGQRVGLDQLAGDEPSPEFAAMVAEQYRSLRDVLGDDSLRQVLDLKLEGYEREEIAARLGCTVRTVTRKLDVIRQTWLREDAA